MVRQLKTNFMCVRVCVFPVLPRFGLMLSGFGVRLPGLGLMLSGFGVRLSGFRLGLGAMICMPLRTNVVRNTTYYVSFLIALDIKNQFN